MGTNDEFGPDTETIRAWLAKRATYAGDARIVGAPRGVPAIRTTAPRPSATQRPAGPDGPGPEPDGPGPDGPEPDGPGPSGPDSNDIGRGVLSALGVDGQRPAGPSAVRLGRDIVDALREGSADRTPAEPAGPSAVALGRDVVDAIRDDGSATRNARRQSRDQPKPDPQDPVIAEPSSRESEREQPRRTGGRTVRVTAEPPRPTASAEVVTRAPLRTGAAAPGQPKIVRGQWTEPAENLVHHQRAVDFGEKGPVRRAMSVILLLVIGVAAAATWLAVENPSVATIGVAGTLGLLIIVVWAVRATCTTTRMSLERGRLSIVRRGVTQIIDVGSPYTPIAMLGEPEDRRWTVLLERPGQPLVVITRSMVDARRFTEALYRVRPELAGADDSGLYEESLNAST